MRKKILYIALLLILALIVYEAYLFITSEGNTYLVVSGQNRSNYGKAVLYINDVKKDTVNLNDHFAHIGEYTLSFGRNKLRLEGVNSSVDYETDIIFIGLYNWQLIEFTEQGFLKDTFYLSPRFE
ncbi:hypothetical protein [Aquimarina celericrescens]|uniref:DUF3221 domain-containing protein n=1 Tax=Aquimarina celericrescens TaxID=1964542 RepID=A0ABW5AT38_9FLAO|nr:hypothetical protein [Aquimarina celericrescens]